jgi:hypothetical protein
MLGWEIHCRNFNDVYEADAPIPGQVLIGQWMDGSRLDVCIEGVYGFKLPRDHSYHTFEEVVEEGG